MENLDFKKIYKPYYNPSAKSPEIVDVPRMQFLAIDGAGDPNGPEFQTAVQSLYSFAYTLKFSRKKAGLGPDYSVGALEGLWWMDQDLPFDSDDRANWRWTVLIWVPDFIDQSDLQQTASLVREKKPELRTDGVRLETIEEGKVAQILHVGPFSEEPATIAKLHRFVTDSGYKLRGKHHEIYLGDPRRTAPEKLKTILRNPICK